MRWRYVIHYIKRQQLANNINILKEYCFEKMLYFHISDIYALPKDHYHFSRWQGKLLKCKICSIKQHLQDFSCIAQNRAYERYTF